MLISSASEATIGPIAPSASAHMSATIMTTAVSAIVESAPTHQRTKRRDRRGHGDTGPPCSGLSISTPSLRRNRHSVFLRK